MSFKEPYRQKSSIIHQAFQMAKRGVSEQKIIDFVRMSRGNPVRVINELKSGQGGGFLWDVEEHHGWMKITRIRPAPKL